MRNVRKKKPFSLAPSQREFLNAALEADGLIICAPRALAQRSVFPKGFPDLGIYRHMFYELRDQGYVKFLREDGDGYNQIWQVSAAGCDAVKEDK
jgi:hypothetical protein